MHICDNTPEVVCKLMEEEEDIVFTDLFIRVWRKCSCFVETTFSYWSYIVSLKLDKMFINKVRMCIWSIFFFANSKFATYWNKVQTHLSLYWQKHVGPITVLRGVNVHQNIGHLGVFDALSHLMLSLQ